MFKYWMAKKGLAQVAGLCLVLATANCTGKTYSTFFQPFNLIFGGNNNTANSNVAVSLLTATPLTNTRVMLTFSKPITLTTAQLVANYRITAPNGSLLHILAATRDASNSNVVFIDTIPQTAGSLYTVVASNIIGVDGSSLGSNNSATFTAPTNADQTGPAFSSVSAVNTTTVDVFFNEAVDRVSSEVNTSYTIRTASCGGALISNVTNATRDTTNFAKVRLIATTPLTPNTAYVVCVANNTVQDIWGNMSSPAYASSPFTLVAAAPKVSSAILSGTGAAATLLVTYDQAMTTTGNIITNAPYATGSCTGGPISMGAATAAMVGTDKVLLSGVNATGIVATGQCTLTVTVTGITSAAGVTLGGSPSNQTIFGYSTTDTTGPVILSIVPTNNTTIVVTFSEPVNGTGLTGTNFGFSPSLSVSAVNCTGNVCTLTVDAGSQLTQTYTATPTGIPDTTGNTITSTPTTFTGDGKPYIVAIYPDDPTTIYVEWSEAIQGTTPGDYTINGSPAVSVSTAAPYPSAPSNIVKLTLNAPGTTAGTGYTIVLPGLPGTTDTTTNTASSTIPGGGTFTGAGTTTAPEITSASSPSPTTVLVNFNEPLNNATIAAGDFALTGVACAALTVSSATQVQAGVVQLVLTAGGAASSSCTVTVGAGNVADLAGNTITTTNNSATFVYTGTGTADTTAPTVVSVVALSNTQVRVFFSESVVTGGGPNAGDLAANYSFSPTLTGGVTGVACTSTYCTLTLGAPGTSAVQYALTVSNINDGSANTMATQTVNFSGIGSSVTAPTLYLATLINSTTVELSFSEIIDLTSGQNTSNYTVTGGLTVSAAVRQADATKVRLTLSPGAIGSSNTFTVTVAQSDTDGAGPITGVTDASGVALGTPNTATFSGSASAPATTDLAAASDLGTSNTDNLTSSAAIPGMTFTGTVAANTIVNLYNGGTLVATAVSNSLGAYSVVLNSATSMVTGSNLFTVATVGSTGLLSDQSSSLTVTWDSTAPAVDNTAGGGVNSAMANGAYGQGSVIPITIRFNDVVYVDTTSGTPSLTLTITAPTATTDVAYTSGSGTNTLTFTYTVAAGNTNADLNYAGTTSLNANGGANGTIKDSAGNNANLTLAALAAAGSLATNKNLNIVGTPTAALTYAQGANTAGPFKAGVVTVTATYVLDPGATPTIAINQPGSTDIAATPMTVVSTTVYTYDYTVNTATGGTYIDGAATVTLSTASSNNSFTIDTTAPAAPGTPDMTAATDTGTSTTDNLTSNTTPQFTVSCETLATVQLYVDGVATGTTGACVAGTVTLTAGTLTEGAHNMTAVQTDVAGNISLATAVPLAITIDTTVPSAPGVPDMTAATDTGTSNSDNVTNNTTPQFTVACENGATVQLYDGVTATGSTGTCAGGTVTLTAGTLTGGAHNINARQTDAANNPSASASGDLAITIDTTAPAAPGIPDMTNATDMGSSNSDNITNNTTPQFTVSCEDGATVQLYDNVTPTGASGVCASSTVTLTAAALSGGAHNINARQTDSANNPSAAASGNLAITIDTTLPTITSVTPASSSSVNNTSVGFTMSEVCGAGNIIWTRTGGTADGSSPHTRALAGAELNAGAFSGTITNNPTLVDGAVYSIDFNCTDLAGNAATTVQRTLVTYSPGVLTITSAETIDSNNNGKIDGYRIGFNKSVNDSTFPGHAGFNAAGIATTAWLVAGFTNVHIVTGSQAPGGTDVANDAVIYLKFNENLLTCSAATQVGCDTEAKPDLTTTAAPLLQDLTAATIAQVTAGAVTEADGAKPILVAAKSLGTTSADAIFSETVELTTAQTIGNYVITLGGGLTVSAATRDGTNTNVVHLTTSAQTGGTTYLLTVNTNVKDLANFNLNSLANTANFDGVTKPVVSSIITKSATTLLITYNEVVTFGSTECSGLTACSAIYTNVSLPVLSAVSSNSSGVLTAGTNSQFFILTVNPMIESQAYTTTVTQNTVTSVATGQKMGNTNNSATFNGDGKPAPNISTDTATECPAPTLAPVAGAALKRVVVQYDQPVGASATVAANYSITACLDSTPAAALCASGNPQGNATTVTSQGANKYTVDFNTSFDTDVSRYQLTIANVLDANGNAVATPTNLAFRCGTDLTPPSLIGISVVSATAGSTVLLLTFSEAVDNVTGNISTNYKYDTNAFGFNVNSAARQTNTSQVQVTFSPAVSNGGHQLLVQNVTDLTGNVILANGTNNAQPFIVNAPTGFSGGPVFTDPFADGTPAGQMVIYDNKIVLGWDGNSSKFFEMDKGLTTAQTLTLDADGVSSFPATQFKNYASGSSGTLQGLDAINSGCVGGSSTSSMTGTACTGAGGTEYILAGGFNLTGAYQSVFRSTDKSSSTTKFTFTERGGLDQSANTYRSMTMTLFKNYLFVASPHIGSFAPRVSRVCALPSGACGNGETTWNTPTAIEGRFFPSIGKGASLPNSTGDSNPKGNAVAIDTMWEYDNDGTGGTSCTGSASCPSALYMANGGRYFGTLGNARDATTRADGGIIRSKENYSSTNSPPGCAGLSAANCDSLAFETITPSSLDWRNYVSIPLPYLVITGADWENMLPSNRIIPAMKAVPYMRTAPNGDLYMIRNGCATIKMQTVCMLDGACNGGAGGTAATANGQALASVVDNNFTATFTTSATGRRQVCPPGYEVPQLWVLPKASGGSLNGSAQWQLVASRTFTPQTFPNGGALPSRKGTTLSGNTTTCGTAPNNKCERNSHLTLLEFVGSSLYVGFDNQDHGANIWRVDMNSATCTGSAPCTTGLYPAENQFTIVNDVLGLDGSATNQRIFSHLAVNDSGKDWLILATRDGTNSMKIYRTANDQN